MLAAVLLGALSALVGAAPEVRAPRLDELPGCAPDAGRCIGIDVYATAGAAPQAWLHGQLAEANRHFGPAGVNFELRHLRSLPPSADHIATRGERDRLGRSRVARGVVTVLVVGRLDNVDEPGEIRGVHWRDRANRKRRWIILSAIAPAFVLAHEMGHFFGCPHSKYPVSIMNKTPREEPPFAERTFAPREITRIERRLRSMVRSGRLADRKR